MAKRHDRDRVTRLAGFALERPGYSDSKFYVNSSDEHGHSKSITFFCPPSLVAQARNLIESGDYPALQTISDLMRDALFHRAHYLASTSLNRDLSASIMETLAQVETENEMAKAERARANYQSLSRRIEKWVAETRKDGMPDWVVVDFLATQREHVKGWPEPYRTALNNLIGRLDNGSATA